MWHRRRWRWAGFLPVLAILLAVLPAQARVAETHAFRFSADAATWLAQAAPADTATFIVKLREDGTAQRTADAARRGDKLERRTQVHQLLKERTDRNDRDLRTWLRAQKRESAVSNVRTFLVFSGFVLTTNRATIEALQSWDRVSSISLDAKVSLESTPSEAAQPQASGPEWNIIKIGANQVWSQLGFNGNGVVVGSLDTGVRYTHVALASNYKCAGSSNHSACWKDFVSASPSATPIDDSFVGHGTHTVGTAVGAGGIGVAPGAKWIACKAFDLFGDAYMSIVEACFDWFMAPGGSPANAPDILINSWGYVPNPPDAPPYDIFRSSVQSLTNAGIFFEASSANITSPPEPCGQVAAPAGYPEVVAVGATDSNDVLAAFSARGPSPIGNLIKPDLVAPGVNIRSSGWDTRIGTPTPIQPSNTSYVALNGTSMAGPHVAGLAALMLDANPALISADLRWLMKRTALGIASTGCSSTGIPNNRYGWGRIRAYEATQGALGLGAGTYDDANPAVFYLLTDTYAGNWAHMTNIADSAWNTLSWSNSIGDRVRFVFSGSRITRIYSMASNRGSETVIIDGVVQGTTSSYAPETRRQVAKTWSVAPGPHVIEVQVMGSNSSFSDIDAFAVDIATVGSGPYDDTHTQNKYLGFWSAQTGVVDAYGNTLHWSNVAGAINRFTFTGNQITYVYSKAANRGKAAITIDGVNKGYIDLYAPSTQRQQSTTFSNLGPGTHTIHIMVSGQKNPSSSDYFVDVDRLTVP
jgi:hypothetical protein